MSHVVGYHDIGGDIDHDPDPSDDSSCFAGFGSCKLADGCLVVGVALV